VPAWLCLQKNGGVKLADTCRGKKTWALATAAPKAYGTHSPGSRQRRSPSEKGDQPLLSGDIGKGI